MASGLVIMNLALSLDAPLRLPGRTGRGQEGLGGGDDLHGLWVPKVKTASTT